MISPMLIRLTMFNETAESNVLTTSINTVHFQFACTRRRFIRTSVIVNVRMTHPDNYIYHNFFEFMVPGDSKDIIDLLVRLLKMEAEFI